MNIVDLQFSASVNSSDDQSLDRKYGLWKYSRHPNYLGEVSFWFGIYIFALASGSTSIWLLACPLVMFALFVFISCPMMDNRSLKKRPDYKEYMDKTPQLLFWFIKD